MTHRSLLELLVAVVALCALDGAQARADVPPPDACNVVGEMCGQSGACTCAAATCTRVIPCSACQPGQCAADGGSNDADSGTCQSQYACKRCRSSSGSSCDNGGRGGAGGRAGSSGGGAGGKGGSGAGGSGGKGGSGAAGKDGGAEGTDQDMEDDGCACSSLHHPNDLSNGWLFAAGLAALCMRRRRRAER